MEKTYEGFLKFKKDKKPEIKKEINDVDDIKQCFVDLEDDKFYIEIDEHGILNANDSFIIKISKGYDYENLEYYNTFNLSDIKETLLFAIPYILSNYHIRITNINIMKVNTNGEFGHSKNFDNIYKLLKSNTESDYKDIREITIYMTTAGEKSNS